MKDIICECGHGTSEHERRCWHYLKHGNEFDLLPEFCPCKLSKEQVLRARIEAIEKAAEKYLRHVPAQYNALVYFDHDHLAKLVNPSLVLEK